MMIEHEWIFWRSVSITETCWLWTGSIGKGGYGRNVCKVCHKAWVVESLARDCCGGKG